METRYFRTVWAENRDGSSPDGKLRLRVNDTEVSLDPLFGHRWEAGENGLMLVEVTDDLFSLTAVELYLELWGGHPGTAGKRFTINGRGFYELPEVGAASGACVYSHPSIGLEVRNLVRGTNAFQFTCERGSSDWGHFIVDNACLRLYLEDSHPSLSEAALPQRPPRVAAELRKAGEGVRIALHPQDAEMLKDTLLGVDYFGFYEGFDDTGAGTGLGWHGFSQDRRWRNHVGTAASVPYAVEWDTSMVADQEAPVSLRALLHFHGGLHRWSEVLHDVRLPARAPLVSLHQVARPPRPFWSRAGRVVSAVLPLNVDPDTIERAELWVRTWDGGAGDIREPFTLNGNPYRVISGKAIHDVVFTRSLVDTGHLRRGGNELNLVSDTDRHGIEILAPGPCLVVRSRGPKSRFS